MDDGVWGLIPQSGIYYQSLPATLTVLGSLKPVVLNMVDPVSLGGELTEVSSEGYASCHPNLSGWSLVVFKSSGC